MNDNRSSLSRVLGRTDILAIGFGTMVGWSWVMLATGWITEAGFLGAILAFCLGGGIILAIGLTYGELTAALPLAGGEFVYAYRSMGKNAAWFVGWIMSMAYLGVAAWESIALATAINYILPIPLIGPLFEMAGYQVYVSWAVVGAVGALVIMLLNLFGIRPAVLFQVMATAALMVMALVILLGGISFGGTENIGSLFTGKSGFFYVVMMIPAMLIGFDVIPQSAEEMNIGPKNIGKMVLVCILLSLIWYVVTLIGLGLAAPIEVRSSGIIPAADVAAYLFSSEFFSSIVIFAGIMGILTSWNGFFLGATRLIFAMGRAGMLPAIFGKVHRRYHTPWAATLLVGLVCMCSPFLGRNALLWFVDTSSLCALAAYCFVVGAFVLLRKREPELPRPFRVKGGLWFGIVTLVITIAYLLLYIVGNLSLSEPNPELIITGVWLGLGLLLVILARMLGQTAPREELEVRIFGERFARRGGRHER